MMFFQKCLYFVARIITKIFRLSWDSSESDTATHANFFSMKGPKILITKNDKVVCLGNLFWTVAIIEKKTGKLTSCKLRAFSRNPGEKLIIGKTRVYEEYEALEKPLGS